MYIDTHAHLTMPEFSDLEPFLARARGAGVEAIVNAAFDLESSSGSVALAGKHADLFAAVGIHPHHSDAVDDRTLNEIRELACREKVVAIGETGLDYHYQESRPEPQQIAFRKFLNLAQELNKPVIVHCREAQEDTIRIIKEENKGRLRGVFHCFAGDNALIDFAREIGFCISFTGNVTFKKASSVRENVTRVPLEAMLLETDCPYLAPEPFRGRVNEPSYLPYIARAIAAEKGSTPEKVASMTTENAKRLFKI